MQKCKAIKMLKLLKNSNSRLWFWPYENICPHQETNIKEWLPYVHKVLKYLSDEVGMLWICRWTLE